MGFEKSGKKNTNAMIYWKNILRKVYTNLVPFRRMLAVAGVFFIREACLQFFQSVCLAFFFRMHIVKHPWTFLFFFGNIFRRSFLLFIKQPHSCSWTLMNFWWMTKAVYLAENARELKPFAWHLRWCCRLRSLGFPNEHQIIQNSFLIGIFR